MKKINKSEALTKKKKDKDHVKYSNPRMRKLVSLLASGKQPVEAGLKAGYSENYCRTRLYSMMKTSNSFRELVEKHAKHSVDLIRNLYKVNLLPRAFHIDEKMLAEMEANPRLAMKHPQTLTRVHRIAGTLEDETKRIQVIDQKIALNIQNFLEFQQTIYPEPVPSSRDESGEDEVVVEGTVIRNSS